MKNLMTLNDIENNTFTVENKIIHGDQGAKEALEFSLPFEKNQFKELAKDKIPDYVKGLDDVYSRIDFNHIKNSIKKIKNRIVPAFAIYNIISNGEYVVKYSYNSSVKDNPPLNRFNLLRQIQIIGFKYINNPLSLLLDLAIAASGFALYSNTLVSLATFLIGGAFFVWTLVNILTETELTVEIVLTHTFSGKTPKNIVELIKNVKLKFDKIYVVEESYNWKIDSKSYTTSKNIDPLVIGEHNNNHYLITKYDVTPLEDFISKEYTY